MKKFPFLKEVNVLLGIKILIVQNNMYKKKSSTIAVMFVLLLTCSLISCDNKNNTSQTPSTHVMIILMFGIMTKHNIGIHVKIHHVEKRKTLVITLLIGVKKHLLEFIKIK